MLKRELIQCFQDTQTRCRTGNLEERTRNAVASSRVYEPGFKTQERNGGYQTMIRVLEVPLLTAAREQPAGTKIAILNCANPHFPGGGADRGALGQEETLCRATNLYPALCHPRITEGFYKAHKASGDYDFTDRVIYTPGVCVFKDDGPVPQLLPQKKWMQLDVISCAAPYVAKRPVINSRVLKVLLKRRIRNIMEAAMDQQVQTIIFGAYGCGAFGNPPAIVAKAFHEVLQENRYMGAFARVIFAIPRVDPERPCPRLAVFQSEILGFSLEKKRLEKNGGGPENRSVWTLPGGRERSGGEFLSWRESNPYFRKQFSVLGDSISTLAGLNPRENRVYYGPNNESSTGISRWQDTWWGKVIDYFGGELLVNNSWSGSQVARYQDSREQFPSGCSDRRTGELHQMIVKPDVILVFMGINDWARGVRPEPTERDYPAARDAIFCCAYEQMVRKLKEKYPKAQIWLATLPRSYLSSNPAFQFPDAYGGYPLESYNVQIRGVAEKCGCALLDLYKAVPEYDTVDGSHPNAQGMNQLAVGAIRQMTDIRGGGLLDCEGDHDPVQGICRRCGKYLGTQDASQAVLRLKVRGTGEIRTYSGTKIRVGRARECELTLESPYAARSQAFFLYHNGQWLLQDDYSRNGTYLNGDKLEWDEEYRLEPGDEILFARKEGYVFLG